MGGEAVAHGGEVDRAMMFMDLDGVTAAEGDLWAVFAGKVCEDSLAADVAAGSRPGRGDFGMFTGPEVVREESPAHEMGLASEELESLRDLERGGEIDGRRENSGGIAGLYGAGGGLREDAGEAGGGIPALRMRMIRCGLGLCGEDVHCGRVGSDGRGVDPGPGLLDGVVV